MENNASTSGTHAWVYDVPPEQMVQSSAGKDWSGIDLAEIIHPCQDFASPAFPLHVLVLNLGSPFDAREQLGGQQGHIRTGGLALLPAEAPRNWHLESEGEVRHLHLYLPPAFLSQVATSVDLDPARIELIGALGIADPPLEALILSAFTELRLGGPGGKLYTEVLATLLAIHLLRRHSSSSPPPPPRVQRLDTRTLNRLTRFIDDSLADDLSLASLAALAGLSPSYFARCFKASLGISPHQYVLQRRIERAKYFLVAGKQSVAEIAHAVGFASESHLAFHLRRLTGLTPSQFRR